MSIAFVLYFYLINIPYKILILIETLSLFNNHIFFHFQQYATTFPLTSIDDMVQANFLLLDELGIDKV